MRATIAKICRYPVKGLTAQELTRADLTAGEGLPEDRRFAILSGTAPSFEPEAAEWRPKSHFITLVRHERLAALKCEYDEATATLTIRRNGRPVARGQLTLSTGRSVIEQFLAAYLASEVPAMPRLVEAPGVMFSDAEDKYLSIINLASVHDLERVAQHPVNPLRFRANLYLEGLPAWEENALIGKELTIGAARVRVAETIERCAATSVDPTTGVRDINIPRTLQKGYQRGDCGINVTVIGGGPIAVGDAVTLG